MAAETALSVAHERGVGRSARERHAAKMLVVIPALYFLFAYVFMPVAWKRYVEKHPAFADAPRLTRTGDRHPGDPLNVALVGTEAEVNAVMKAAEWYPADALGLKSDLKIAADTVFRRQYDEAPVSSLYLFDRKEDLAFEQPVGGSPSKRHHVRFWRTTKISDDGRPIWIGSASYDERVGLSHTTGQITHHISGDVDAERDHVLATLEQTKELAKTYTIANFHPVCQGRNGGGDKWHTDGNLAVGVIAQE